MKERSKFDFKKHTLPPVKRWYLIKIVFYVLLLTVLLAILYYRTSRNTANEVIQEPIEVEIETQKKPN